MIDLEKREELIKLYETYCELLTDKQRDYFEAYYFDDLSLAEIADNFSVSRNAIFDQIKKTISNLEKYEEALKVVRNVGKLSQCLDMNNIDDIKHVILDIIKE